MQKSDSAANLDRQVLQEARQRGSLAMLGAFVRLSGPGWLQSAITLGGGSLAGALYLGVIGGYSLLWAQLLAIVFGVIMLCAISYATLSTGERPFHAINRHVNPVLGWGWALATLVANMVWCLPQFSLATAAVQQNLLPDVVGAESSLGGDYGRYPICAVLLAVAVGVVLLYDSGRRGVRIFEAVLKTMVAIVVLSFFGVVLRLAFSGDGLPWSEIFAGFVPNLNTWSEPAAAFAPYLAAVDESVRGFWRDQIIGIQRNVMIAAVATAVGINMTFLLPYSMLRRGWDREFRGMAIFDLSTGMALPYLLVTTCVVIASAGRFHAHAEQTLLDPQASPPANLVGDYESLLNKRLDQSSAAKPDDGAAESEGERAERLAAQREALPEADKQLAAMIVRRDAFNLAQALSPLTGATVANFVFGVGVLGMALSTIIILMLISGFVFCEILGFEPGGAAHRWGSMAPAVGVLCPFVWSKAQFWLAVPTSVFGMALLPIAYITFLLMMNSASLLGADRPQGGKRFIWNLLMVTAASFATAAAGWSVWSKVSWYGVAGVAAFLGLAVVVHLVRKTRPAES